MIKRLTYTLLFLGTLCAWPLASGCAQKATSIERSERIHESDPQMVAPGKERVE